MKKNTLSILIVVTVVLIAASVFISSSSDSNRSEDQSTGQKIVPSLYERLNDISNIEITTGTGKIVINKSDDSGNINNNWIIKSKDNYPGNIVQIRKTLIQLAELEKVDAKTKKQKNYSRLGVQALTDGKLAADSTSSQIVIKARDETVVSIIIGNTKAGHSSQSTGLKKLNYVRLSDDEQVWLVAGNLNLPPLKNFMNTEVLNIPSTRIQKINISHPKGSNVTITKKSKTDKAFILKQLKKNKELSSPGILNSLASALANLNFDDVTTKNNDKKFKNPITLEFVTFNGLSINMNVVQADNKYYLWLDAKSSKPATISLKQEDVENKAKVPDAKQEAIDINKTHSRWLYTIADYKGQLLSKKLKDLVKSTETKSSAK